MRRYYTMWEEGEVILAKFVRLIDDIVSFYLLGI